MDSRLRALLRHSTDGRNKHAVMMTTNETKRDYTCVHVQISYLVNVN